MMLDAVEQLNEVLVYRDASVQGDHVEYVLVDTNECNIQVLMQLGVANEDIDAAELASGGMNIAPIAIQQLGATWFDPQQWRFVSTSYADRFRLGYDPFGMLLEHVDRQQLEPDTRLLLSLLESYMAVKQFIKELFATAADDSLSMFADAHIQMCIKRNTWSFDQVCWIVSAYVRRDLSGAHLEGVISLTAQQVLISYMEVADLLLDQAAIPIQPVNIHLHRQEDVHTYVMNDLQ